MKKILGPSPRCQAAGGGLTDFAIFGHFFGETIEFFFENFRKWVGYQGEGLAVWAESMPSPGYDPSWPISGNVWLNKVPQCWGRGGRGQGLGHHTKELSTIQILF